MKKSLELILTALTVAIGVLLPMAFHWVSFSGKVFLPMYYPVALFAFLLRPFSVGLAAILTPLTSSLLTGMPPMNPPMAFQMAVELAVMAVTISFLSQKTKINYFLILLVAVILQKGTFILLKYLIAVIYNLPFASMLTADLLFSLPGTLILLILIPPLATKLSALQKQRETLYAE